MDKTPTPPTPTGGGSAAGQAYREDMARKGEALLDVPSAAAAAAPANSGRDARVSVRKKVSGKARIAFLGSSMRTGKLVDLSEHGVCVLMNDSIPNKTVCTLECEIFQGGKHVRFSTPALSVYSVLASGVGFKVGFKWATLDARTAESVQTLMRES